MYEPSTRKFDEQIQPTTPSVNCAFRRRTLFVNARPPCPHVAPSKNGQDLIRSREGSTAGQDPIRPRQGPTAGQDLIRSREGPTAGQDLIRSREGPTALPARPRRGRSQEPSQGS